METNHPLAPFEPQTTVEELLKPAQFDWADDVEEEMGIETEMERIEEMEEMETRKFKSLFTQLYKVPTDVLQLTKL